MVLLLVGTYEYNSTVDYAQSTQRWLYSRLCAMYMKMGMHVHTATFMPLFSDAKTAKADKKKDSRWLRILSWSFIVSVACRAVTCIRPVHHIIIIILFCYAAKLIYESFWSYKATMKFIVHNKYGSCSQLFSLNLIVENMMDFPCQKLSL